MSDNTNLNKRKNAEVKTDEYYTLYKDIKHFISFYKDYFYDKKVYCNCDNLNSNIVRFFINNFERLNLRALFASGYYSDGSGSYFIRTRHHTFMPPMPDPSYDSSQVAGLYDAADIIITNPPFSKFRAYYDYIKKFNKDIVLITSNMAPTYVDIGKDVVDEKIYVSPVKHSNKYLTDNFEFKEVCTIWMTTFKLDYPFKIRLHKKLNEIEQTYIDLAGYKNVLLLHKMRDIPIDYDGIMAVPINFLYEPDCRFFKILSTSSRPIVGDKEYFKRAIIQKKKPIA